MTALDTGSAADAAAAIGKLEEYAYNPFQLFVADSRHAWLTVYRDRPRTRALEPGIHVIGNVEDQRLDAALGAAQTEPAELGDSEQPRARKLTRIRERVEKLLTNSSADLFEDLADVCREHVEATPFESTCVHLQGRYGTRISLLLELADVPEASRLWATDGPPCERPFENLSALLKELDAKSRTWTRG